MDVYLRNFWSFYKDFLDTFQSVSYNNIPFTLIIHPVNLLSDEMFNRLNDPSFESNLYNKITSPEQIQPCFDRVLDSIRSPLISQKGKILFYDHGILRFPKQTFSEYFDSDHTININRETISTNALRPYRRDVTQIRNNLVRNNLIQNAKDAIASNIHHPVFSDNYFQEKLLHYLNENFFILDQIDRLLNHQRLSCIIVDTTQDEISRIFVLLASTKGIPSICMQHGVIVGEESYMPVLATKQAVYGEYEKQWYVTRGVRENQIEIIGHPQFDSIFTMTFLGKSEFNIKLGLNPDKQTVLICSHKGFDLSNLQSLINSLREDPSIQILIKPHPYEFKNQTVSRYQTLQTDSSIKIIGDEIPLYHILANIDAIIVETSTAGLQAMLIGVPVFSIKFKYDKTSYTYIEYCGYAPRDYFDTMEEFTQTDWENLAYILKKFIRGEDGIREVYSSRRNSFLSRNYPVHLSGKKLLSLIFELTSGNCYVPRKYFNDGTLVIGSEGKVYVIENGLKRHISSPKVFNELGFNWAHIKRINNKILDKIPHGFVIHSSKDVF